MNKSEHSKQLVYKPGPGSYEIPTSMKMQTSLSKQNNEKRFKSYQTLVPGPGQYNTLTNENLNGPKALILSKAKEHKQDKVPGPGSYEPDFKKVLKSQSGYQLPKGQRSFPENKQKLCLPGPGTYETDKSTLINQRNAVTFGPQRKIKVGDEKGVPGPGQYNTLQVNVTLETAPKSVFGKAGRSQSYNTLVPGPGTYKNSESFDVGSKKGFSIAFKTKNVFQNNSKIPGPGSYHLQEIDKLKFKCASFSMPKSPRLKVENQKQLLSIPGPQKYNINLTTFEHKSFKVGKSARKGLQDSKNVPGPGAYELKTINEGMPKFSMPKSSVSWVKSNNNPGPGKYDPKLVFNTQYQSVGVNVDQRRPFYDEKKLIPGPGQYTITQEMLKKGFSVGNQKRPDLGSSREKKPGPGQYNVSKHLKGQKST